MAVKSKPAAKAKSASPPSVRGPGGEVLPPGEVGELCVRGDNVFRGYLNDADATAAVFFAAALLLHGRRDRRTFLLGAAVLVMTRRGGRAVGRAR